MKKKITKSENSDKKWQTSEKKKWETSVKKTQTCEKTSEKNTK